jgi:hypothetical protein
VELSRTDSGKKLYLRIWQHWFRQKEKDISQNCWWLGLCCANSAWRSGNTYSGLEKGLGQNWPMKKPTLWKLYMKIWQHWFRPNKKDLGQNRLMTRPILSQLYLRIWQHWFGTREKCLGHHWLTTLGQCCVNPTWGSGNTDSGLEKYSGQNRLMTRPMLCQLFNDYIPQNLQYSPFKKWPILLLYCTVFCDKICSIS